MAKYNISRSAMRLCLNKKHLVRVFPKINSKYLDHLNSIAHKISDKQKDKSIYTVRFWGSAFRK